MERRSALIAVALAVLSSTCVSAEAKPPANPVTAGIDALYPDLEALYVELHKNPELSLQEAKTAAKFGDRLKTLGFEVTSNVGGYGVVATLKNGKGPVVMVRAELDALPVEEKTGLPYASKATATDVSGKTVSVMHACGHDIHMAVAIGSATLLSKAKDKWRGTLLVIGQPAEEKGVGAKAMIADGLLTKFPKPEFAVALHDSDDLPSGQVSWVSGYTLANTNSVDVTIYGKGGHGASPQSTVDPVVLAARTVVALQTIVAREVDPRDPAVVTVGSIHGGTANNIIPDEVKLQLTVRSLKPEVQKKLLASIERIVKAESVSAGAPKEPTVTVAAGNIAVYNDPAVTKRVVAALVGALGQANVVEGIPAMAGDDFAEYGKAGVPSLLLRLGAVEPKQFAAAAAAKTPLPSLHSPLFAPDKERTIKTGVAALSISLLELLAKP